MGPNNIPSLPFRQAIKLKSESSLKRIVKCPENVQTRSKPAVTTEDNSSNNTKANTNLDQKLQQWAICWYSRKHSLPDCSYKK